MVSNQRVVCIIQARMGSTRLPGKVLMNLGDKPMLQHLLDRLKDQSFIDHLVVAVTTLPEDQEIISFCRKQGVDVRTGSPTDLIDRHYQIAKDLKADLVVRIPSDNPLVHSEEVERIIRYLIEHQLDFASNLEPKFDNHYPDGIGAEVMTFSALRWLQENTTAPAHREHVTRYFYENPGQFKIGSCICPREYARTDIRIDINTAEDMAYMNRLIEGTRAKPQPVNIRDIIEWHDREGRLIRP